MSQKIVDRFVNAALEREATEREAWDHGWSQESYRRSEQAAMSHDHRNQVRLRPRGVKYFEEGTKLLLGLQQVRQHYDADELWELAAQHVGMLPLVTDADALATATGVWLEKILSPIESVVILPIANVAPLTELLDLGPLIIGHFDEPFRKRVQVKAGRPILERPIPALWWSESAFEGSAPLVLAYFSRSQLRLAIDEAGEAFEDAISAALMMQPDLDALKLFSLRGDANRPGLRGLTVDRETLGTLAETNAELSKELGWPHVC